MSLTEFAFMVSTAALTISVLSILDTTKRSRATWRAHNARLLEQGINPWTWLPLATDPMTDSELQQAARGRRRTLRYRIRRTRAALATQKAID